MSIPQNIVLFEILSTHTAHLDFVNFEGRPDKYNSQGGVRTFNLVFDDLDLARALTDDGWNVKWKTFEDREPIAKLLVKVGLGVPRYPVRITLVSSRGEEALDENNVKLIDYSEFSDIDLTIRPRPWPDDNGNTRYKAYLKTMYATLYEDEVEKKWANRR